jgi:hypothetical protein
MIAMAVFGGVVASGNRTHQAWFIVLGVLGVLLVLAQGYYLHRDDQEKARATRTLQESVINLQGQTVTLMNAIRLQATVDDFRNLEGAIGSRFSDLEAVIKGQKAPSIQAPKPELPPSVVEHVRVVQRRAASTDHDAPYGIQVVLQTDATIQPVAFKINFDKEISNCEAFIVGEGVYAMMATAYSKDRKAFMFSFHSPAFTPNSSLVVSVQSKYDVRVTKVEKIQPLF